MSLLGEVNGHPTINEKNRPKDYQERIVEYCTLVNNAQNLVHLFSEYCYLRISPYDYESMIAPSGHLVSYPTSLTTLLSPSFMQELGLF
jgi:hypothetical protein